MGWDSEREGGDERYRGRREGGRKRGGQMGRCLSSNLLSGITHVVWKLVQQPKVALTFHTYLTRTRYTSSGCVAVVGSAGHKQ